MKRLVIIGASGHGKVVADIAVKNGYERIDFLDDDESVKECGGYPVIGKSADAAQYGCDVFVAIGNKEIRRRMQDNLENIGVKIPALVHPAAVIADSASVGAGSVVMAGAVINPGSVIGRGCIVNTCASVDHDCIVCDYTHVSVGAHLCGTVEVGAGTWIGAGAVISNNISVCSECMIGAGAVVIKDIKEAGTYVGVPVRKIS